MGNNLIENPQEIRKQLAEVFEWNLDSTSTPEHEEELIDSIQAKVWEHELSPLTPEEQQLLNNTKGNE